MEQPQQQQGGSAFSQGMKVTFGVIFALFLLFVVAPCAMCGGCGVFGAAMQEAETQGGSSATADDPGGPTLEFTEIDTRVTEKNDVWWKYAWKVKIENHTDRPKSVDAKIKWVDVDGFEIDSAREYNLRVSAESEEVFDGSEMIQLPSAEQIDGIEVEEL